MGFVSSSAKPFRQKFPCCSPLFYWFWWCVWYCWPLSWKCSDIT